MDPFAPLNPNLDRVYNMLAELTPLVDQVIPYLKWAQIPPAVLNIKRRLEDMHEKVMTKRVRLDKEDPLSSDDEETDRTLDLFFSGPSGLCSLDDESTDDLEESYEEAKRVKLVSQVRRMPYLRTMLEFTIKWRHVSDAATREYQGLLRIIAGYAPFDLHDPDQLKTLVSLSRLNFFFWQTMELAPAQRLIPRDRHHNSPRLLLLRRVGHHQQTRRH
jgi:hypothetical protein